MKFREPNLKCYRNLPELVSSFYRLHGYICVCPGCCAIRLKRNELAKRSVVIISMEDVISLIPEEHLEQILIHLKKKTSKR